MDIYNFDSKTYNKIVEIVKFRFYKQIKESGIIFKEILFSKNLITEKEFYILVYEEDKKEKNLRFKNSKSFLIQLIQIAQKRLAKLEIEKKILLNVEYSETYGPNQYFIDTEINGAGIASLRELLLHLDKIRLKNG